MTTPTQFSDIPATPLEVLPLPVAAVGGTITRLALGDFAATLIYNERVYDSYRDWVIYFGQLHNYKNKPGADYAETVPTWIHNGGLMFDVRSSYDGTVRTYTATTYGVLTTLVGGDTSPFTLPKFDSSDEVGVVTSDGYKLVTVGKWRDILTGFLLAYVVIDSFYKRKKFTGRVNGKEYVKAVSGCSLELLSALSWYDIADTLRKDIEICSVDLRELYPEYTDLFTYLYIFRACRNNYRTVITTHTGKVRTVEHDGSKAPVNLELVPTLETLLEEQKIEDANETAGVSVTITTNINGNTVELHGYCDALLERFRFIESILF